MKFKKNTKTEPKEKDFRASFRTLLNFIKEELRTYVIGIALAVVVGILELTGVSILIPALAASFGDESSGMPAFLQRYLPTFPLLVVGIGLAVLILLQATINFFRESYFLTRLAGWRTEYSLDYVRSIAYSDWKGLGKLQPGEVEVMLTRNIALSMKLRHLTANFIADVILSIMYIVIVLIISWYTSFMFLALGMIFVILHQLTLQKRMHYTVLAKERYIDIARKVIEHFADARSIAISNKESLLNKLRAYLHDAAFAQLRNDQLNVFFLNIHQPLIIFFFIIAAAIFYTIGQPISTLVGIFYIFYRAAPHIVNVARNYGVILGESPIDVIPEITAWRALRSERGSVRGPQDAHILFQGVDLSYKDAELLLKNVRFEVSPGELVCIVGKSGTGKSTILDVICGFQEPRKGEVRLGGVLYHELDWAAWRNKLGLLRSEGVVVSGTWLDNVAFLYGDPEEDKAKELLKSVGLLQYVETFPEGIHSHITARGGNLSAGQRQRLLMARALYREPELLILDEPTSNLDQKTESEMYNLLLTLRGEMTIIVVSHRDEILSRADRIYEVTTAGRVRVKT